MVSGDPLPRDLLIYIYIYMYCFHEAHFQEARFPCRDASQIFLSHIYIGGDNVMLLTTRWPAAMATEQAAELDEAGAPDPAELDEADAFDPEAISLAAPGKVVVGQFTLPAVALRFHSPSQGASVIISPALNPNIGGSILRCLHFHHSAPGASSTISSMHCMGRLDRPERFTCDY